MKKQPATQKNIAPVEYHFMTVKQQFVQQFLALHQTDISLKRMEHWLTPSLKQDMTEKLDAQTAQRLAEDSFFFISDAPDWSQYIIERMKREPNTKLKKLIHTWQQPIFFFGEIIDVTNRYVAIQHAWTNEVVYVLDFSASERHIGENTFLLLVKGLDENIYYSLSMAIILTKASHQLFDAWRTLYYAAEESYQSFFRHYMQDCWRLLISDSMLTNSMPQLAKQLLVMLDAALIELDIKSDPLFLFVHHYLKHKPIPNMRKKASFIAGALQFGMDYHFIPDLMSAKQLAEVCDVSTATVYNYARKLERYYKEEFAEWHLLEDEQTLYYAGTDATTNDKEQWHFEKICVEQQLTDEVSRQRLKRQPLPPFVPKTAEDLAQHFAYMAYEQSDDTKRYDTAKMAYMYDTTCIDALLILSDQDRKYLDEACKLAANASNVARNRIYFKTATVYFDLRQIDRAFDYLNAMTSYTESEQYVRLAVLCALGETTAARQLLDTLRDNAVKRWFAWLLEPSSVERYTEAMTKNAFVDKYRQKRVAPLSYPTNCFYTEGDPTQGKLIYLLIYPTLERLESY
ncbi:hypothetical protein [Kurthia massiliensis]|uniref:hypothetical protein n=1 Tax=Kurthia massiliensis TaxID=1033739 RepID=UPI00028A0D4E|nr:hypothetical protein [Kurthia massiliensis]